MLLKKIVELIEIKDMNNLKTTLANLEEMELLDAFYDLSPEEQVVVFRLLGKDTALSVFEQLDTDEQQNLLRSFADDKAKEFINEMAPDDRVRLLDEMPAGVAKRLLSQLSPEERAATSVIMGYEAETAGRIMTTEFITLRREMTAAMALEKVRQQASDKETVYTLYVTDNAKKLEGVLTLKELVCAANGTTIEEIMSKKPIRVTTDTDQEEVARILQDLDLLAIPVVDKEERVVGIVTIDDAIDILEEEATEDILDAAGFADIAGKESDRSEVLIKGRTWKIWAVRLPFLVITLAAGLAAGLILEGFEEILESVVIVAFFIPLIMDMGGNVGTQSSTVFARGVVLGHININHFLKPFLKELWVGVSMGSMVGAIAGVIIAFWMGVPMLGIAVGLALVATMTLAAVLGFLVPFTLMKLKVDQAAGSAPIITSIKDISGLFIYFALVAALMGGYLYDAADYEITAIHVEKGGLHFVIDPEGETATVVGRYDDYKFDIIIPETITVMGEDFYVVEIGAEAFRGLGITSVYLPYGVEAIGDNAFRSNYLTSIYLPASLTELGDNAFRDNLLTHLTLAYKIEDFGDDVFRQNLLTEIKIPLWMTEVFEGTFRQNQLTSIIFHEGVTVIGEDAFMSNLLAEINLPASLIEIEEDGFRDNLLTHVTLPDSLQTIGFRAFMDNPLVSIFIPSSVTEWTFHEATGQGDHFHNNRLERIYTDANNTSTLAAMLTAEVMGHQYSSRTELLDPSGVAHQRNNLVEYPVWE